MLDREHVNRIIFDGQEGLDPIVDLSLRGAQIRALIQGRASKWHRHLLLMPTSAPVGEAVRHSEHESAFNPFDLLGLMSPNILPQACLVSCWCTQTSRSEMALHGCEAWYARFHCSLWLLVRS